MTLSEYSHLKHQIVFSINNSERHNHLLSILKELFRDDINSPRRYEQINTMTQLIKVLELRDLLSEQNVAPFKLISQKLPNSLELLNQISEYEKSQNEPRDFVNYYGAADGTITSRDPPAESFLNSNPISGIMSKRKKQRVFKTVTDGIGSSWRDLGRNLKIRECDIDDINDMNCSLSTKAVKLLEVYDQIADPQRWFFVLCDALERTRRKDLAKSLQEIMAMNI